MSDLQKKLEDEYIEEKKKTLQLTFNVELGMRSAYANAATIFRAIGRHEGDRARIDKIIDALGIIKEEPTD